MGHILAIQVNQIWQIIVWSWRQYLDVQSLGKRRDSRLVFGRDPAP
jgi:hypothetical protein